MIKSKEDYKDYLKQDKIALGKIRKRPRIIGDEIWKFQILLRKCEYYKNCKKGPISNIVNYILLYKFHKSRLRLGFSIPLNVFGPGLSIAHYGQITVNGACKVGKNCRIHEGVTIGATNGREGAPVLGDNVFIGTGAKIIGDIEIGNNIAIGANAVVVNSFSEHSITIAGVPAKKVSEKGSRDFIKYKNINRFK